MLLAPDEATLPLAVDAACGRMARDVNVDSLRHGRGARRRGPRPADQQRRHDWRPPSSREIARPRRRSPGSTLLFNLLWSAEGAVNPDGEAEAWFLQYYIPSQIELPGALLRSVTVYASKPLRPFQEIGIVLCIPTEPMVHDAIRHLEDAGVSVRLGAEGLLRVVQSHRCARAPDEWSGVGFANSFVYYDNEGMFLRMEGAP